MDNKKRSYIVTAGRPPRFETAEELEQMVLEYFDNCPDKVKINSYEGGHKELLEISRPSMSGLALFLGFADRRSLYDYEKHDKYSHSIKIARSLIERFYEVCTQAGAIDKTFGIFAMKQFGWTDKQEVSQTIQANVSNEDLTSYSPEDLALMKEIHLRNQKESNE